MGASSATWQGTPRSAQAAATARTSPSGPAASTRRDARGEPRRQQLEHVGGRQRDLALGRRHELGGARRLGVAEGREQRGRRQPLRERREQRDAEAAAHEQRRRSGGGGVEAAAERPEHVDLGADLRERRERRAARLAEERHARVVGGHGRERPRQQPVVRERAQHVELPGLAGRERALEPDLDVRPERLAGRHRATRRQACSSCRLLGSTCQARAIACTAALAPASVVMHGTLAEIAARRIW